MKPIKLTMQAFGSYGKKTTIDFTEPNQNLFLVTGDTGAGKTTIFDAIVFALYGEASSTANKKDGIVMQSQFTSFDIEPFVELEFSEKDGEDSRTYKVRRVPKHLKYKQRGAGKDIDTKDVSGSVTLTMPDNTEYPQKEVNKKLEEIVGLTKSQFMQVAMIAQGEFMELLRAKSDDKKVIFRKLFNTEFYQRIVDELKKRKSEKETEIATIRTECQTVLARVIIPKDYEQVEEIDELKKSILDGEITFMEQFLPELKNLCEQLEKAQKKAEKVHDKVGKIRDEKRDAYTNAKNLLKTFKQLDKAEADLLDCQSKETEIKDDLILIEQLRAAYEIKAEHEKYKEAEGRVVETKKALKKQQEALPELLRKADEASKNEEEIKRQHDQELKNFSKISDRVETALKLFEEIEKAQKDFQEKREALELAETNAADVQKEMTTLEQQEEDWKSQLEKLSGAEKQKMQWDVDNQNASVLKEKVDELIRKEQDIGTLRSEAEKTQTDYATVSKEYKIQNDEYEGKRQAFLDAQAGILAQRLESGKACPVCGSLEHPNPCQQKEEHTDLSEEVINALGKEVEELRTNQVRLAAEAESKTALLSEKGASLKEELEKLYQQIKILILEISQPLTLEDAQNMVKDWVEEIKQRGVQLQKNVDTLHTLQKSLQNMEIEKKALSTQIDETNGKVTDARAALEGSKSALKTLEDKKDYSTEAEATDALTQAEQKKEAQETLYMEAKEAAINTKKERVSAETLINEYTQNLPKLEEQLSSQKTAYEDIMEQEKLTEGEWQDLTLHYKKEKADELQEVVNQFNKKRAAAEALKKSATETIGDQKRPDIVTIETEKEAAEKELEAAKDIFDKCKEEYKIDKEVYDDLAPRMETRQKVLKEHAKLDTLYRRVSGNVKGSRMDLETFVQRYYLEKILYAANRRFLDMSAGQFELRMVDIEKAGEGKNKGLDLMVYSNVTGKEREVRTLSGGESFMAALALALGMADQIQENSAAINLDIMFIDEGFGSLDDHSRNQAVKVLLEMAEGSKLIGIISHVTELKQEIENQLLVRKDESGSYVKWQIS